MATTETTVEGGRELDAFLRTLAPKMQKNVNRAGLRAGAAVFREEARQNVPFSSGALRKSIRITTRGKGREVSASVKAGSRVAWYANLVEFGTRPHVIKAKPRSALDVAGTPRKEVNHPGSRAKPFMRPAVDAKFLEAVAAVRDKIRERLTAQGLNTPSPMPLDPTE